MQFQRIGHDHHEGTSFEGTSFEGTSYSSWFFLQSTSYSYPDDNNHNKSLVQTSRLFVTRYQRLIPKAVQEKAISASSPSQLPDPMDFDMTNALQLFMLKTHSCLTSKRSHFQTPTKKRREMFGPKPMEGWVALGSSCKLLLVAMGEASCKLAEPGRRRTALTSCTSARSFNASTRIPDLRFVSSCFFLTK